MKIAIFDSGVGGLSFKKALEDKFPEAKIVYIEDKENIPYGDKTPEKLLELTLPIFKKIDKDKFDAVLIACNTVTTNIINDLREVISTPLIGVEPMLKPASKITKTGSIAVCATSATLTSKRYEWLKENFAVDIKVIEPNCNDWAYMIENNRKNELKLKDMIEDLKTKDVDVLVLGCTHYHWIEKELKQLAGNSIDVIQPTKPVIDQLDRVIRDNSQTQ
jgi:glutamate racemase